MTNWYHLTADTITIFAKKFKKHNELINYRLFCEINTYLAERCTLYEFFCSFRNTIYYEDRFIESIKISGLFRKYMHLYKMDDSLITIKKYDETELRAQHRMLCPNDDYEYFKEWYGIGLVDIEYFAVSKSIDFKTVFTRQFIGYSRKDIINAIKKIALIYVSMYDSNRMEIIINNKEIYNNVLKIVKKHCIRSQEYGCSNFN